MRLSYIIVNYNTTEETKNCIKSIMIFNKEKDFEIIVVDNYSTDNKCESIKDEYPNVKLYLLDYNAGFGSGCNYGFSKSSGDYILFLNPDTLLKEDIGAELIKFLEENDNAGVCSVMMESLSDEIPYFYNNFPNIYWEFLELTAVLHKRKIKKLYNIAKNNIGKSVYMEIDWAIGACLCVKRRAFEIVNGFDEKFFLYYEDTDFQKRIKDKGYRVLLNTNFAINHKGKSSIDTNEYGNYVYYINMHKSKLLYYSIHNNMFYVFLVRIINISALLLRIIKIPFINNKDQKKSKRLKLILEILEIYLRPL